MEKILLHNGTVVTFGENCQVLNDHSLVIGENGKIEKILPSSEVSQSEYKKVIQAKGKLIMPGFINAHMHFYSSFARGLGKAAPSANFPEVLENLWWRLDKKLTLEDNYYSTLVACIDAIRRGTTTLIDHHASPNAVLGSLGKIRDAMKDAGLRGSLCYELSDRDGEKIAMEGIEENINFIKECNENGGNQFKGLFGMHASFTINESTMRKAVEEAKKYGAGFHIHVAEDLSDQESTVKRDQKRVVERLFDEGLLGPQTVLGHCIHVNDKEMDLIKESKSIVVTNMQSNMNNAVGIPPLFKLMERDILVGMGTDAMTVNMLEELRSGLWIQKLTNQDPSVGFMELTKMLIENNPKIANRYFEGLGTLEVGNEGDVILMDYDSPTPLSSENFLGHLVFGLSNGIVDTTIVGGNVLMENKKILGLDVDAIMTESQKLSQALWDRF